MELKVFQVFQHNTPSSKYPVGADRATAYVPYTNYCRLPLFSQIHLETVFTASVMMQNAFPLLSPLIPRLLKAMAREQAVNPIHLTSIG